MHLMVVQLDPIAGTDRWIAQNPRHLSSHSCWQGVVAAADTAQEMCQEPVASERHFESSFERRMDSKLSSEVEVI